MQRRMDDAVRSREGDSRRVTACGLDGTLPSRRLRGRVAAHSMAGALLLTLCVACAALAGCSGGAGTQRDAAAYVGDQVIYEDEVSSYTAEFREVSGLTDDAAWANYLETQGKTAQAWREDVIRTKADHMLVEGKAAELGITADAAAVEERVAQMRAAAGASDDDGAWEAHLAQSGQTPDSLLDALNFSSIEQQVAAAEIDFSSEVRDEMCDDYLKTNMADQVVRHYLAFAFETDEADAARALADELGGLSADGLAARFGWDGAAVSGALDGDQAEGAAPGDAAMDGASGTADSDARGAGADRAASAASAGDAAPSAGGDPDADGGKSAIDLGWDFIYDEASVDPDLKLRRAKLSQGALYEDVLEGKGALYVVYCAEREEFGGKISYASIKSSSLKSVIESLTLSSQWAALLSQYLTDLEAQANVQVVPMPDGLPYDVVE